MGVVGPQHPLAGVSGVTFDAIKPFGWVLPPVETSLRHQIDSFFMREGGYQPSMVVESVSYLANRSLLGLQDLVGLLPAAVVDQDVQSGALAALDWQVPFGKRPVGISRRTGDGVSPASAAFQDALRIASRDHSLASYSSN